MGQTETSKHVSDDGSFRRKRASPLPHVGVTEQSAVPAQAVAWAHREPICCRNTTYDQKARSKPADAFEGNDPRSEGGTDKHAKKEDGSAKSAERRWFVALVNGVARHPAGHGSTAVHPTPSVDTFVPRRSLRGHPPRYAAFN
jgi:hypothetical protein